METYIYNERFICLSGGRFWNNGNLSFTHHPQPAHPKYYRTVSGPAVSTTGVIFDDSNVNTGLAIRRLTAVKFPEKPGYEKTLFENQERCFQQHNDFWLRVKTLYARHFEDFLGNLEECIEHHADKHEKRELRIHGFDNLMNGDAHTFTNWVRKNRAIWKLKKGEWAKPNKKPRMIVDLGVEASLMGFRVTHFLKCAQAEEPIFHNGGEIRFCKSPDLYALEDVFENLINPKGRYFFVYFSDDACLSFRDSKGRVRMYNLDISSCDASHGPSVFDTLLKITPDHLRGEMANLISQCQVPLKLTNREDPRESLRVRPIHPMLYSGWTGTTAINNVANISIAVNVSEIDELESGEQIRAAAERAGYVVTGWEQELTSYTDLQFLKHSPVLDTTGVIRPMLNIGVLLRASGVCHYDLPGSSKTPMLERAAAFQRGLIQGAYPRTRSELFENMKAAVGSGPCTESNYFKTKTIADDYPTYTVANDAMFKRYRLNDLEIQDVVHTFGRLPCGYLYASPALEKILELDYGLKCKYQPFTRACGDTS